MPTQYAPYDVLTAERVRGMVGYVEAGTDLQKKLDFVLQQVERQARVLSLANKDLMSLTISCNTLENKVHILERELEEARDLKQNMRRFLGIPDEPEEYEGP